MLTRRDFGFAGIALAAAAAGYTAVRAHANEETMTGTTDMQFEITVARLFQGVAIDREG